MSKKTVKHDLTLFTVLFGVGSIVTLSAFYYNTYSLLYVFIIFLILVAQFKAVNHGNNFRVIHLATGSRVKLIYIMAILISVLSTSARRELNFITGNTQMTAKCVLDKEGISHGITAILNPITLPLQYAEEVTGELIIATWVTNINPNPPELIVRIAGNLGSRTIDLHEMNDLKGKIDGVLKKDCDKANLPLHKFIISRFFQGIINIFKFFWDQFFVSAFIIVLTTVFSYGPTWLRNNKKR